MINGTEYYFANQTFTSATNNTDVYDETIYTTTLPNGAVVEVFTYVYHNDSTVTFANDTISMAVNGVKYSMKVSLILFITDNFFYSREGNKLAIREAHE